MYKKMLRHISFFTLHAIFLLIMFFLIIATAHWSYSDLLYQNPYQDLFRITYWNPWQYSWQQPFQSQRWALNSWQGFQQYTFPIVNRRLYQNLPLFSYDYNLSLTNDYNLSLNLYQRPTYQYPYQLSYQTTFLPPSLNSYSSIIYPFYYSFQQQTSQNTYSGPDSNNDGDETHDETNEDHWLDEYRYSDLTEWQERAQIIREGILLGTGLSDPPQKCELNPIIHSKRTYENYTVENVAFESLSGFFVTGNLYRPRQGDGPFAAILCPHGHFRTSAGNGRFRSDQQIRCAILATMGAVVFSYDMVGWGESNQTSHYHPKVLALQLWNSIRVIDFLISINDVDSSRIGVTGASGGGTQTFLITAVDDRIAVSIPTVMVSADSPGGCKCETGMPIHKRDNYETNNAEIAALAAPRPQLIISCGSDWTKNTPQVEYPFIKSVYSLYGAEDMVENLHLEDEGHNYGASKRAGAYKFFAKHLGLSLDKIMDNDQPDSINESSAVIEEEKIMHVFNEAHPRPSYAIKGDNAISMALSGS